MPVGTARQHVSEHVSRKRKRLQKNNIQDKHGVHVRDIYNTNNGDRSHFRHLELNNRTRYSGIPEKVSKIATVFVTTSMLRLCWEFHIVLLRVEWGVFTR